MLRLILSKDFSISFSLIVYILRRFNSVEGGGGGGHWCVAEGERAGGRSSEKMGSGRNMRILHNKQQYLYFSTEKELQGE